MNIRIIYIYLFIVLTSCFEKNYNNTVSAAVEDYLLNNESSYKYLVLIPNSGCSGCISNAENFFLDNANNKNIKFIFTYIVSKKNLLLTLDKKNLYRDNVYLDNENRFYYPKFKEAIYPIAFVLKSKKIESVISLDNLALRISND